MRPINKQDLRPEYVVYSMVQKMNAGLYSLSSLPGAPQDNAEVPSGSHTSSTLPSSLDNLSLLRVSPPPSTAASILPGLSSDDEMEVDEIVSASKSGEKVQTLKNTALLEMEKWAMSEGRMQDVLNSRQRIDSAWTPEKRIKYYQTFVGLKETLQSQKWKCVENGRMPCPYIYSFLGKTRHTFTRMKSCLSKETEDVSAEQLEDEDERYHTTAVHASLLPPTPPPVVASLVPRLSNDNLDDRMDVDEVSTSKLESKLVKNTNLKNAAFLEMEKWAMSEGRMQDVLSCRKRVEPSWTPEKRIESYRTLIGLKDTVQSQNWKCIENGCMPFAYIYSFLGKSQQTFKRVESLLNLGEKKGTGGVLVDQSGDEEEECKDQRPTKRQKFMVEYDDDDDDNYSDQETRKGRTAQAPAGQNREVLATRSPHSSSSTASLTSSPKLKSTIAEKPTALQTNSHSPSPPAPLTDESSNSSNIRKFPVKLTEVQKEQALREMKEWAVAEGRMDAVKQCGGGYSQNWPPERQLKVLEPMMELYDTLQSRSWTCVPGGLMPLKLIDAFLKQTEGNLEVWT